MKDSSEESHMQRVIWSSKNSGHPKHSTRGCWLFTSQQSQSNHIAGVPGVLSPRGANPTQPPANAPNAHFQFGASRVGSSCAKGSCA